MMLPLKIVGAGRYLPKRVVPNSEVEQLMGVPEGTIAKTFIGVKERRWVDGKTDGETGTWMAAEAGKEALTEAGLEARDLDLIINASGTQEQAIPDGGPLIQRHLGLGSSGIPALSVHSTCLSFLVGLHTAALHLSTGNYRHILITAGDISSCGINPKDGETFPLFGDVAAAVVVSLPEAQENCGIEKYVFQTFGDGADYTRIQGGGSKNHPDAAHTKPEMNFFEMDGRQVYFMALRHGVGVLEGLQPGLTKSLGDIKAVVPHQASGLALKALRELGWEKEKIATTLERLGNCVGASIPATLYEVIRDERIQRGEKLLIFGTGAGLSIGGALLTY